MQVLTDLKKIVKWSPNPPQAKKDTLLKDHESFIGIILKDLENKNRVFKGIFLSKILFFKIFFKVPLASNRGSFFNLPVKSNNYYRDLPRLVSRDKNHGFKKKIKFSRTSSPKI